MNIYKLVEKPNKSLSNKLLFIFAFSFIFLTPVFPDSWNPYVNNVLFSILFFSAVYALEYVRKEMLSLAIIAFITQWISVIFNIEMLKIISDLTNVIFFQILLLSGLSFKLQGVKKLPLI
ncbi:MAG: hypothetical protein K8R74_06795 [Bacteroidales bacterium]|nr:hypothetical protein [Bacteroidales bacterium]